MSVLGLLLCISTTLGSLAWAIDGASRSSNEDMRLYVSARTGAVDLKVAGVARDASVGATVDLPARIVTSANGGLGLRQQRTAISIAADSDIEIPETARDGQLIARLVQRRGNVFYDVETRPIEKLHVDTPYLVAVVKGTQFNVSVDDERTMISLFEGQLELRAPDGSATIELNAGQIAIRSAVDASIRVLSMDAVVPQAQADTNLGGAAGRIAGRTGLLDTVDGGLGRTAAAVATRAALNDLATNGLIDARLAAGADITKSGAAIGLDTRVDLGAASVDLGLDTGVDLGGGSVDLGLDTGVDLGAGSVDVGLDTGLDVGGVDLGLDATIDISPDTGIEIDLDLPLDPLTNPGSGGLLDLTPDPEEQGGGLLPLRIL